MKVSDDNIQVGNPKKLVEAAGANVTALQNSLLASYANMALGSYETGPRDSSVTDGIYAYSMPVFQLAETIESMKRIKDIGERAMKEHQKELILEILPIVFMVIPFAGEALGPLVGSTTAVARIALLAGEAGNAALTVADIIEDPESAPFAILGWIAGVGGGTKSVSKGEALAKASKARSAMKDSDLAKFPDGFKAKDSLIRSIVKDLCAKR